MIPGKSIFNLLVRTLAMILYKTLYKEISCKSFKSYGFSFFEMAIIIVSLIVSRNCQLATTPDKKPPPNP